MNIKFKPANIYVVLILLWTTFSVSAKPKEFHITLKDHVFIPSEITIPANTKVKLIILIPLISLIFIKPFIGTVE
jgi:hypothetical protein